MNDAKQLVSDAQGALASPPPADTTDWDGWLNDVIQYARYRQVATRTQPSWASEQQFQAIIGCGRGCRRDRSIGHDRPTDI